MIALFRGILLAAAVCTLAACGNSSDATPTTVDQKVERGRYLVTIGACGECHNPGGLINQITPESETLTGTNIGFRGPWGTSYPMNLRKRAAMYNEELFVRTMKVKTGQPPMPWSALHGMKDEDLASLYAYLKHLGPAGDDTPDALPDAATEPKTPYIDMMPRNMPLPTTSTAPTASTAPAN